MNDEEKRKPSGLTMGQLAEISECSAQSLDVARQLEKIIKNQNDQIAQRDATIKKLEEMLAIKKRKDMRFWNLIYCQPWYDDPTIDPDRVRMVRYVMSIGANPIGRRGIFGWWRLRRKEVRRYIDSIKGMPDDWTVLSAESSFAHFGLTLLIYSKKFKKNTLASFCDIPSLMLARKIRTVGKEEDHKLEEYIEIADGQLEESEKEKADEHNR